MMILVFLLKRKTSLSEPRYKYSFPKLEVEKPIFTYVKP